MRGTPLYVHGWYAEAVSDPRRKAGHDAIVTRPRQAAAEDLETVLTSLLIGCGGVVHAIVMLSQALSGDNP